MSIQIDMEGDRLAVRFAYDDSIRRRVKTVSGYDFQTTGPDGRIDKRWLFPYDRLERLLREFPNAWLGPGLDTYRKRTQSLESLKLATSAPHPVDIVASLYDYQKIGIQFLRQLNRAILGDVPGLGKTRQCIGWANHFMSSAIGQGVLIICPATGKYVYRDEILTCIPDAEVVVIDGRHGEFPSPGKKWVVLNWDLLSISESQATNMEERGIETRLSQIRNFRFSAAIFSEAHYAKALSKSLRGQAAIEIGSFISKIVEETGTPVEHRPLDMLALLRILGKVSKREEWSWKMNFCDGHQIEIGRRRKRLVWDFSGASNLDKLRKSIEPFFLRRTKEDVIKELPPITYSYPVVDISNRTEYETAEDEALALTDQLAKEDYDADQEMELRGKLLAAHQKLGMVCDEGKVQPVAEIVDSYTQAERKIVVFSQYIEPLRELYRRFEGCALLLTGSITNATKRHEMVHRFQTDPKVLVALCSIQAFGTVVTMTEADAVLFLGLPWGPKDWEQARDRCALRADNFNRPKNTHCITVLARNSIDSARVWLIYEKAGVLHDLKLGTEAEVERFRKMFNLLAGSATLHKESE